MEYRLVPILHPLHAIGQRYFSFLFTTFGATNRCKASPGMIRGEVQGSVFLYFGIGGAVTGRVHRMTPQGGDIRCTRLGEQLYLSDMLIPPPIAVPEPNPERTHFTVEHGYVCAVCCKMLAFSGSAWRSTHDNLRSNRAIMPNCFLRRVISLRRLAARKQYD